MEDRTRPFAAVSIGMFNHENADDRFGDDGGGSRPYGAPYRINLTALSQRYNLYLVGVAEEIHVYEPDFPYQTLGGPPHLAIVPELYNEEAQGYILPERPHCINHLIVGILGDQEIVAIATDSGNITAYYTSAIFHAIQNERAEGSTRRNPLRPTIRPFFVQSVAESAWGLAIHSQGRMIAVSCNVGEIDGDVRTTRTNAEITVFAFALVSESTTSDSNDSTDADDEQVGEWTTWEPPAVLGSDEESIISCRKKNYKIVLAGQHGHTHNIPCISFINGDQDQNGSWLLSVGLNQEMKVWQIWSGRCCRTWKPDVSASNVTRFTMEEFGWVVAPLNSEIFRPVPDLETFVGYSKVKQYWGRVVSGDTFDITNVVESRVPSNGTWHPRHPDFDQDWSSDDDDPYLVEEELSESEATADETDDTGYRTFVSEDPVSSPLSDRIVIPPHIYIDLYDGGVESVWVDHTTDGEPSVSNHTEFSEDELSDTAFDNGSMGSFRSTTSLSSFGSQISQEDDIRDALSSTQNPAGSSTNPIEREPQSQKPSTSLTSRPEDRPTNLRLPNPPILHCSTSQVRLFGGADAKGPHLFCSRLLRQALPRDRLGHPFEAIDRLNMVEQIPELGIVIIASQFGRCAICTLTKRKADNMLGLRVDWVVPTKEQERAGLRPDDFLLGIAVGPVQGRYASFPESQREPDTESWKKDRVINGIPTTFASMVIDVDDQDAASTSRIYLETSDNQDSEEDDEDDDEDGNKSAHDGSHDDSNDHNDNEDEIETEDTEPGFSSEGDLSTEQTFASFKPFNWTRGVQSEAWAAIEPSRRYRLMMTYRDFTVLTYEISRGVERNDICIHVD